ncbi:hypothetical protein CHISP_0009 [Chitinispirillum alkaliphilum]|nr:hypothetical protein CHISP_0009 [Chitinispirillum alkaliphilum]
MKKATLITLAVLALSFTVYGRQCGGNFKQRLSRLKCEFELSSEQIQNITPIFRERSVQIKTLRDDKTLDSATRRTQIQEVIASANESVRAELTSEQQSRFDEMMNHRRGRCEQRVRHGRRKRGDTRTGRNKCCR